MALNTYLKDTQAEMKHVSWSSRSQIISYTAIVIGISLFTGVYLGVLDFLFAELLKLFIIK